MCLCACPEVKTQWPKPCCVCAEKYPVRIAGAHSAPVSDPPLCDVSRTGPFFVSTTNHSCLSQLEPPTNSPPTLARKTILYLNRATTATTMPAKKPSTRTSRRHRNQYDDDDELSSWDSLSVSGSSSSGSSSSDAGIAAKLPTLPDLRFEQSYLATIRGFLHEDRPSASNDEFSEKQDGSEKGEAEDHHHKVEITHSKAKDEHELWLGNLRVEW